MDKPKTIAEYHEWARSALSVDFEAAASRDLYTFNAQQAYNAIGSHRFIKDLNAELATLAREYKDWTGSELFIENTSLELVQKTYDSAVNKSFRINILANERFPNPPQDNGWVVVDNLPERINDCIRGIMVCKFIDGPSHVTRRLAGYAYSLGVPNRRYSQERDEGYYAYHFYATFDVPLIDARWHRRQGEVEAEIQVTTQLQDVLRHLTHRFYEQRRLHAEEDSSRWKWDYTSNRFRVGYLTHALHLLESVIVQSRDDVHETSRRESEYGQ